MIRNCMAESNHDRLISMWETRWVQKHESIKRFHEMYIPIIHTLEEHQEVINNEISQKAHQFLATIIKPDFIWAFNVTEKVFSFTLQVCKYLQKINCDLTKARDHVQVVIDSLNTLCQNADMEFNLIFM
eukprot:XP_016655773.1 PREDICTED: uncharacterized protein LOC107882221 [Acyrthosiphon pisum]